jgi:hypothetical protein
VQDHRNIVRTPEIIFIGKVSAKKETPLGHPLGTLDQFSCAYRDDMERLSDLLGQ